VSLKDYFDACGFALFSDQRGVIYEAHPRAVASPQSGEAAGESTASKLTGGSLDVTLCSRSSIALVTFGL